MVLITQMRVGTHGNGGFAAEESLFPVLCDATRVTHMLAGLSKVSLFPWFFEHRENLVIPVSKVICKKEDL